MSEKVTLPAPVAKPSQLDWELVEFQISLRRKIIRCVLRGNNGEFKAVVYTQQTIPTAQSLLSALNTSNNSGANPSMIKRVYNRLIADGHISGTVGGTPD